MPSVSRDWKKRRALTPTLSRREREKRKALSLLFQGIRHRAGHSSEGAGPEKKLHMTQHSEAISTFVKQNLNCVKKDLNEGTRNTVFSRLEKVMSVLPDDVLDIFLSGSRPLTIRILPNTGLPIGMRTTSTGSAKMRRYEIIIRDEHAEFQEDLFIGSVLRELGHVVAEIPPEADWPSSRGDRARFKEKLELGADVLVWKWGLRHYDMRYLSATYPPHWVDKIVEDVEKMLLDE
jgi:hypothetical protein